MSHAIPEHGPDRPDQDPDPLPMVSLLPDIANRQDAPRPARAAALTAKHGLPPSQGEPMCLRSGRTFSASDTGTLPNGHLSLPAVSTSPPSNQAFEPAFFLDSDDVIVTRVGCWTRSPSQGTEKTSPLLLRRQSLDLRNGCVPIPLRPASTTRYRTPRTTTHSRLLPRHGTFEFRSVTHGEVTGPVAC